MSQYAGIIMKTVELSREMWGITFAISLGGLVWGILVRKEINPDVCACCTQREEWSEEELEAMYKKNVSMWSKRTKLLNDYVNASRPSG